MTTLEFSQSNYLMIVGVLSANRKLSEPSTLRESPHLAINLDYTQNARSRDSECNGC